MSTALLAVLESMDDPKVVSLSGLEACPAFPIRRAACKIAAREEAAQFYQNWIEVETDFLIDFCWPVSGRGACSIASKIRVPALKKAFCFFRGTKPFDRYNSNITAITAVSGTWTALWQLAVLQASEEQVRVLQD